MDDADKKWLEDWLKSLPILEKKDVDEIMTPPILDEISIERELRLKREETRLRVRKWRARKRNENP